MRRLEDCAANSTPNPQKKAPSPCGERAQSVQLRPVSVFVAVTVGILALAADEEVLDVSIDLDVAVEVAADAEVLD